ncbi:hybrid sensor histidine kinase/response regulator [Thermocoleostomius sinensis]|uniref:histidine kinase n=1 Tax=Thermocoleostomius sinensis A174 TaxID=2016057 RepID=A0A9E8ZG35_9CYAN|nr:response regulator [Thermocoleostomius sinensis]WAL61137.1 response regulator [Thermocoleostomius sinensis A174]
MSSDPKVNILLVDNHPENLLALEAVLSSLGENLVKANSGEEALRCLLHQDFAVILLDVQMPGMNGFETANLIRNRSRSRQTPIIFLTAFSTSDDLMFKGYSLGAVDYLHKPIDPIILSSKVTVFVDLFRKTEMIKQQRLEVERQSAQLKRMNAQLRQSEERFRLLSSCSPVGIFLLDIDGQCTYTNPRCQEICGFTAEEGLGEGWLQFLHPDDRDRAVAAWKRYIQESKELTHEYRFQPPTGAVRWTHVRTSPMYSAHGELIGHVGTIEDITARKQADLVREQMLREQIARREAETANRMKDEFLAVLSHELRTPLNAMLGWSRLLRTRKLDQKTIDRALETIERNATAQSQLIEDILDVSKIIRGKLQLNWLPVNLVSVIEAAIDSVRPQAEAKSIDLNFLTSESAYHTWGDAVRLQQVVWNLLSNAIKFTPEAGRVTVRLDCFSSDQSPSPAATNDSLSNASPDTQSALTTASLPPPDRSSSVQETGHMQITITDTGIGISPEFLPHVFDRFRQADSTITRSHNGLGLGLAIVQHLVELHGGTVEAASDGEGQGATFTVKLPIRQTFQPAVTVDPIAAETQSVSLSGINILLVEDEADARDFLSFVLQQYGATIEIAPSVQAALTLLSAFNPDVLISDIAMPGQDGYTLMQEIRSKPHLAQLPAIALTAYSGEAEQEKALASGFDAHLTKPVEVHQLIHTIDQVMNTSHRLASRSH